MKQKLFELVKNNTMSEKFKENNAQLLCERLGISRNLVSQYLNEFYNDGLFVKINTRPVCFLEKNILKEKYGIFLKSNLISSFDDLNNMLHIHDKKNFNKLVGVNGSLKDLIEKCKASITYPPHGLPVILHGPTGTGKSEVAKLMYEYGRDVGVFKKNSKFIHVNCSEYANNPELITANLFGYKKGAFTGADTDNEGLIKAADNGVLFLDEVHCLRPECQEKLFLFMDSGKYHMLGDSGKEYQSDVLIVFATTENLEEVLLKTLLRRIPIRMEIPSLEQRGKEEKRQFIIEALERESKKVKKNIYVSNAVLNILLNLEYQGNIGELFNVIQATCMKSLFKSQNNRKEKDETSLEIRILDLPEEVIKSYQSSHMNYSMNNSMIQLDLLKSKISNKDSLIELFNRLLENLCDLQNNEVFMDDFFDRCNHEIDLLYNKILCEDNFFSRISSSLISDTVKNILNIMGDKYGIEFCNNQVNIFTYMIISVYDNYLDYVNYFEINAEECESLVKIITAKLIQETSISDEIMKIIKIRMDVDVPVYFKVIYALVIYMYRQNKQINQRIGVILSHGYATATSMATAVNQLLDEYVFDAIDVPLDSSTDSIIKELNDYLSKRGSYQELILIVDMGSLEEIYKGIVDYTKVNISIVNNANTKLALLIGDGIRLGKPTKEIFEECKKNNEIIFRTIEKLNREKVILCSCATGIGTAEKLRIILEDSLPKNSNVKVLTYDYTTLVENQMKASFFEDYEVICIVGTLNPNIQDITFIPIEELIVNDSFQILMDYFKEMSEEDMKIFQKNILKNFSLSNIIGNLTILNPNSLLEHVTLAIEDLQNEMGVEFSNNISFGLYVHICCLIERLVKREGDSEYVKQIQECTDEVKSFVRVIKKSFREVETYYRISMPIEEIEYIYIYVSTMMQQSTL